MVTSLLHHSDEKVWLDEEVEKVLQRKKDIEALEKVSIKANAPLKNTPSIYFVDCAGNGYILEMDLYGK